MLCRIISVVNHEQPMIASVVDGLSQLISAVNEAISFSHGKEVRVALVGSPDIAEVKSSWIQIQLRYVPASLAATDVPNTGLSPHPTNSVKAFP